jgi:3-(3-hydroxy-phenyl)propionate hydroxylase
VLESLTDATFLDQPRRAGTIHPSTLEMLDDIGLYEKLEPRGLIAPTMGYWDRQSGEMFALFDHAVLKEDTRFPYVLQCERLKIVDEAMQLLKTRSIADIRMGVTLQSFTQDSDGIQAIVNNESGESETINGSYIVSGEGAHSIIRKSLNIEFEGYTYPDRTMILSVVYDFDRLHGYAPRNYLSDPVEWANLFKWPELWRVVLGTNIDDDPETVMSDASIHERMQRLIPDAKDYEVLTRSLYTVHQRVAATFRSGYALLAGDAAHADRRSGHEQRHS